MATKKNKDGFSVGEAVSQADYFKHKAKTNNAKPVVKKATTKKTTE